MSGYYVGFDADFKENENGMLATAEDVGKFLRALNYDSAFKEIYSSIYVYEHGGLVPIRVLQNTTKILIRLSFNLLIQQILKAMNVIYPKS